MEETGGKFNVKSQVTGNFLTSPLTSHHHWSYIVSNKYMKPYLLTGRIKRRVELKSQTIVSWLTDIVMWLWD